MTVPFREVSWSSGSVSPSSTHKPLFHHRFYKRSLGNHLGFVSTLGAEMYFTTLTKRVIKSNWWKYHKSCTLQENQRSHQRSWESGAYTCGHWGATGNLKSPPTQDCRFPTVICTAWLLLRFPSVSQSCLFRKKKISFSVQLRLLPSICSTDVGAL